MQCAMSFLNTILKRGIFLSISLLLAGLMACQNHSGTASEKLAGKSHYLFDEADFTRELKTLLPASLDTATDTSLHRALADVYISRAYRPVWVSEQGALARTRQLIQDLDSLNLDGLDPEDYQISRIKNQLSAVATAKKKEALHLAIGLDTACTRAYLKASRHLLFGKIVPRRADSLWFHENDTVWSAPALLSRPDQPYVSLDHFRSRFPGYASMRQAYQQFSLLKTDTAFLSLRRSSLADSMLPAYINKLLPKPLSADSTAAFLRAYQQWRGLKITGKADSATRACLNSDPDALLPLLAINMERLRWLPQHLGQRAILINIPAMELFFFEKGQLTQHMKTVVGRKSRQTPSLNALMKTIIFNPSWGVPPTILKKDVKSGLGRSGSSYLARKGLRAYTRQGKEVPRDQINAANASNYVFRQPPGPRNALGIVKFDMPNKWDIYLHDTPHRWDFQRRDRALSSGCIRLEHPRSLAVYLLQDLEGKNYNLQKIDTIAATRKTRYQKLEQPFMVHLVYLTAFPDSNMQGIRFLPDIYEKDERLQSAMSAR